MIKTWLVAMSQKRLAAIRQVLGWTTLIGGQWWIDI